MDKYTVESITQARVPLPPPSFYALMSTMYQLISYRVTGEKAVAAAACSAAVYLKRSRKFNSLPSSFYIALCYTLPETDTRL